MFIMIIIIIIIIVVINITILSFLQEPPTMFSEEYQVSSKVWKSREPWRQRLIQMLLMADLINEKGRVVLLSS